MKGKDEPKAGLFGRIVIGILGAADHTLFNLHWIGLENMPQRGPLMIAANHVAHIDTLLMARLVWDSGRIPRFMAKSSLFEVPVLGPTMKATKQIPVTRNSTEAAKSLSAALDALHAGESIIIYPEGTTTKDPDKWPMYPKTGLARLVLLDPSIPVIPISQWGAQDRKPGEHKPRRVVTAKIGRPLDLSHWRGQPPTAENLARIGAEVMAPIRAGLGEIRGETPPDVPFRLSSPTRSDQEAPRADA